MGGSTIEVGNRVVTNVDSDTQFLVRTGSAGSYTYTTYNINNLPVFADGTIEVFWSDDGTFTENVYIKTSVPKATTGTHLFATTNSHTWQLTDGDSVVHAMNVVVDGEERTILTTDANVISILENNVGKLFHVDFDENAANNNPTYGYVTDVKLVNEDSDLADSTDELCDYMTNDSITVRNGAIAGADASYNLTDAVEVIYSDRTWTYTSVAEAVEAGCDVWVVDDSDSITNRALTIYVGTALSDDASITVLPTTVATGTNNIADISDPVNGEYTVTLDDRNTAGKLTISADNDYALYKVDLGKGTATLDPQKNLYLGNEDVTVSGLKFGDTITVTVYPENGVGGPTTYTINVSKYVKVDGAITDVKSTGGSVIVGGSGNLPMYSNFQDAITHVVTLNSGNIGDIAVTANNALVAADLNASNEAQYTKYLAKDLIFGEGGSNLTVNQPTFSANAQKIYFANGTSDAIQGVNTWESDWTYVLQMSVRPNGANSICDEVVYVAFQVK